MKSKTHFLVLPRSTAEAFTMAWAVGGRPDPEKAMHDYVVVSIGSLGKEWRLAADPRRLATLRIEVEDIDAPHPEVPPTATFGPEHAREIIDFHERWRTEVRTFLVHCEAGISRSRGVATALALMEGNEDEARRHIDEGLPNALIIWEILDEHKRRTGERIPMPVDLVVAWEPQCGHDRKDLRREGPMRLDELMDDSKPYVCCCCGVPGMVVEVDRFEEWRRTNRPERAHGRGGR